MQKHTGVLIASGWYVPKEEFAMWSVEHFSSWVLQVNTRHSLEKKPQHLCCVCTYAKCYGSVDVASKELIIDYLERQNRQGFSKC